MSTKKKAKCDRLTSQQREFCHIRFNNPNLPGAECVFRAYPEQFSTYASAAAHASRLLKNVKVERYLDELNNRQQRRLGAAAGRVLREEATIAFFDPIDILDPVTRDLRTIDKIPEHLRRAIRKLKIIKTQSLRDPDMERTEYRYTFSDKGAALARLERILGMYEKDNEQVKPEPAEDKWVLVPTDRELSLLEWTQQVNELNEHEAANKKVKKEEQVEPI